MRIINSSSHTTAKETPAQRAMTGGLSVEDTLSGQTGVTANVRRDTRDGVSNQI